jgi:hypothetical protein
MKKAITLCIIAAFAASIGCKTPELPKSDKVTSISTAKAIDTLLQIHGQSEKFRIEKGVSQLAALWVEADGSQDEFDAFCAKNFVPSGEALNGLYNKLEKNFEVIWGTFLRMEMDLKVPLHLDIGELEEVDYLFGAYSPSSHLNDDLFANKIAMLVSLNFPFYSLPEKLEFGPSWSRQQWAYARMGDLFTSRVPADLQQNLSTVLTEADNYISSYNIHMSQLRDDQGKQLFTDTSLVLITHWGLRDELKSHYSEPDGVVKQDLIYQVMKRIIDQSIPKLVIDNPEVEWMPFSNRFFQQGLEMEGETEGDARYATLLSCFKAVKEIDPYTPKYPTYISRKFDSEMEIPQAEVESLFVKLVSSPQVGLVAKLIKQRLGRDLKPYDIWYDGFKSRSGISQSLLDANVAKRYPSPAAFEAGMPNLLTKLGWPANEAASIASKIQVDPSRGAGHAWGAAMKSEKSRLRTRIAPTGMNYKGFNIAIHEFGHNVEQTYTLHGVDHYMLSGVPNTAFTEAVAFMFQKRDLWLMGHSAPSDALNSEALDVFWSCYEIMGVSLVDMKVWQWMYANPDATPAMLKENVIRIAKEVWNAYYAPVFGSKDEPILAIYSHMIDNPLYLSAYPIGHLVEFQVEEFIRGKSFAGEFKRIWAQGRITPTAWMVGAVGSPLSVDPLLRAVDAALAVKQ